MSDTPDPSKKYDFIIVGGGIAGLTLAYRLMQSELSERSLLIVEQSQKDKNDRTISFWADQPTPFDEIVYHSWKQLRFATDKFTKEFELGDFSYKTIRGIDLYQFVEAKLETFPNVVFLRGRAEKVENGKDGAYVSVEGQRYYGQWVFDSRLKPFEFKHEPVFGRQVLRQYFKGWLVSTPYPAFDQESATLFDFRLEQRGDMRFFYLLPFSEQQALVEYVGLQHTDYDVIMQNYVENILQLKDYEAEPLEGGAILLTDRRFKRRLGKHIMAIGSAGGMVKPSSGYAFTRILRDTDAIVNSLVEYNNPFKIPAVHPFYYVLDSLMLEAMNRFTGRMKTVFSGMFKYNPAQRVFRYLDERASVWEVILMVMTMPFKHLFIWVILTDEKKKDT
jgi:lycopene beta-cyclase